VIDKCVLRSLMLAAAVAASLVAARDAAADEPQPDRASGETGPFRPRFIGDLRAMALIRTDNNYFAHANTYSYSIDPGAGGVQLNLGAELLPRIALIASAHYAIDGADRDSAQLRLQSAALLGVARWAFYRTGNDDWHFDATLQGGFGRYAIKETYLDPAISPQTYEQDDGAWGGMAGLQASLTFSGFVAVAGYGFHYAPATVSDRIGGTVQAGGHELSIGLGVWL
jgi:hypothetical protein